MKQGERLGMGLVGPGFIAPHHIDAVRRLGNVDVIAIAGSNEQSARKKAEQFGVPRSYGNVADLLADSDIDVVHNTTPNYLHYPVSMAVIEAGKQIISDKPLGVSPEQCRRLRDSAKAAGVMNAVTFNYRGNPLVQQARVMNIQNAIGRTFFVHGHYLQDWMTSENVYSWRSDPERGGVSSALADIGSHWCDLAEHISGRKITSVLADVTTVVKTRYSSGGPVEAFQQSTSEDRRPIEVQGEDLASILLRFEGGIKGCLSVGQVLAGNKNNLQIEMNGRTGSLRWNQERQNELWIGRHSEPNAVMAKDPSIMLPEAGVYTHLPGGHQEGWSDAFSNVIADIYSWIRDGGDPGSKPPTVCTFADATHICEVVDAMLKSHSAGGVWQNVEQN